MMAAGAVVTAEGLWVPGQKLISIPSGKILSSYVEFLEEWEKVSFYDTSGHHPDKWQKTLKNEDGAIIHREVWDYCPFKFSHGDVVKWEHKYRFASNNPVFDPTRW